MVTFRGPHCLVCKIRRLPLLLLLVSLLGVVPASSAMATEGSSAVDLAPPASIRVCRSSGAVEVVPFKEYVQTVVSVEFYTNWPRETLRAGAVAIKSYAWYFIKHPISGRCDLGDTTRHQVYAPEKNRRTLATDAAVQDSWHLRMWDPARNDIAFAQYCSAGCASHKRSAGEGRYMDQNEAFDWGRAGKSHIQILNHFYRNLPMELTAWTDHFALRTNVDLLSLDEPPAKLVFGVVGVNADDRRVRVAAHAVCKLDGSNASFLLDTAGVTADSEGNAVAVIDELSGAAACENDEASLHFQIIVNNHVASTKVIRAWRSWTSAEPREVTRIGDSADPVQAAVQVSQSIFAAVAPQKNEGGFQLPRVGQSEEPEPADDKADFAVVARTDSFPDALGATALAGTRAPILLHPAGPDATLSPIVRDELVRILDPGATVHLIGGPNAISTDVETAIDELGFAVLRTSGSDRVSTSLALGDLLVEQAPSGMAIIVRGYPDGPVGWADAVAVGPWAARTRTPILVSRPGTLDAEVEAWIEDPANGIEEVLVIGGPRAVSSDAEARLADVKVTRVAGGRRETTALAMVDELWGTRGTPEPAAAVVHNVFDAGSWSAAVVSAVPAARADAAGVPVWQLVPPTSTGRWLDRVPGMPVLVVGGRDIVTSEVEDSIAGA